MNTPRGNSHSVMRQATCKDCLREEVALQRGIPVDKLPEDFDEEAGLETAFVYNERAAEVKLERGQTRSDRCKRHRQRHRINIQGMAVPYIDVQTIGEALGAHSESGPTGPFGGLGRMPEAHRIADNTEYNLAEANVSMTDQDILDMLDKLKTPSKRVLVAKAGTGTGKSTFMPYRLLDPPPGASFNLAALGPIIVTEPRVQATTGVASYVGSVLSGAGGVGPGFPVGFQVKGNKAHDESCQLIYVTDGTMINWLREGRLSTIGTVIVDEAHERSTNIDFIMGYLKKAVERYPHLRVIITSATFDEDFYQAYFGGPSRAEIHRVEAEKKIGYGFPLFADLDAATPSGCDLSERWEKAVGSDLPLRAVDNPDDDVFVVKHFQPSAPALKESDVTDDYDAKHKDKWGPGVGWKEPLHQTTRALIPLRFVPSKYGASEEVGDTWKKSWTKQAPRILGEYVVDLVRGLDSARIYGDVLGFLPTTNGIEEAVAIIKAGLDVHGDHGEPGDVATVFPLISTLPTDIKERALLAQVKGDTRKIVISTNLAETSLTVEGVRFVVDSGLIAQDEWDPEIAQGGVQTSLHSQAGIRQRWGRVGRKAPGWAFPLYTKEQFLSLPPDTAPASTRSNLENLIMTAKAGGIDHMIVDGGSPTACEVDGGSLVNSVCISSGEAAVQTTAAIASTASVLRNVTAVGTGPTSAGIKCVALGSGSACQMQAINTIADGENDTDVRTVADSGATSKVILFNSDFTGSSSVGVGASIATDSSDFGFNPSFVNPDRHDFHETADAPSVDTGSTSGSDETTDPDGLPRVLGRSVDIGAYEFAPRPTVSKVKITKRGKHSLRLNVTVHTQKLPAAVSAVASHGRISVKGKRKVVAGSAKPKHVKLVIKHLKAGTTYDVTATGVTVGGKASGATSGSTR